MADDDLGATIETTMAAAFDAAEARADESDGPSNNHQAMDGLAETEQAAAPDTEQAEAAEGEEAASPDESEQAAAAEDTTEAPQAPEDWTEAEREAFSSLPPEVQETIAARETERKQITEYAEQAHGYVEALESVVGPRREMFARDGMSVEQGLAQLFALSDYASKDPQGFVQWFAQQRGIALDSLAQPAAGEGDTDDDYVDPALKAAQARIERLEQHFASQAQAQEQARQHHLHTQVQSFATETGEDGALLRPHYETVRQHMAALLQGGAATTIQQAYEDACWANPTVRAALVREQQTRARAEASAAAARAQKAARQPRTPGGQFTQATGRTIEETMAAAYDSAQG